MKNLEKEQRIKSFGEVFTPEHIVKQMCDLAGDVLYEIHSRVLEPSCGTGNFIVEIFKRKADTVLFFKEKHKGDYPLLTIAILMSIYGVELLKDNAIKCRKRLYKCWCTTFSDLTDERIKTLAKSVIKKNIICGNFLTTKKWDDTPIIFSEYTWTETNIIKKDFKLSNMLEQDKGLLTNSRCIKEVAFTFNELLERGLDEF